MTLYRVYHRRFEAYHHPDDPKGIMATWDRAATWDDRAEAITRALEGIRAATDQLHPERARSCRNAITMASVMVDEIRLRAHARPLDEAGK